MLILDILFKPLNYLSKIVDSINHLVGIAVAWLTVLMVINVFVVVVLRYVFSIGFVWLQELYVWSHAAVFLLGAGYALLHEGHVRIDVIYRKSSVRYKSIVNILGITLVGVIPDSEKIIISSNRGEPIVLEDKSCLPRVAFDNAARRLIGEQVKFLNLESSSVKNPVKRIIGKLLKLFSIFLLFRYKFSGGR